MRALQWYPPGVHDADTDGADVPHPPEVRSAVLEDLEEGLTVPAVSEKHGVPIGTIRRWKRKARDARAAAVDERRASVHVLPSPPADDGDSTPAGPPVEIPPRAQALADQLRELEAEMGLARKFRQFGALSSLRREWRALRDAYDEALLEVPAEDVTDLSVDEQVERLKAEAEKAPDRLLIVWVEEYLNRHEMRVVPA